MSAQVETTPRAVKQKLEGTTGLQSTVVPG